MLCAQSHKTFLVPYIPVDIICPRLWPRCIFFQLVLSHCSVFHFQGWVSSTNSREEVPNGSGPVGGDAIPHSIGVESSLWASRHQGREGQRDREGQLPCLSIQTWPVWWFSVLLRRRRKIWKLFANWRCLNQEITAVSRIRVNRLVFSLVISSREKKPVRCFFFSWTLFGLERRSTRKRLLSTPLGTKISSHTVGMPEHVLFPRWQLDTFGSPGAPGFLEFSRPLGAFITRRQGREVSRKRARWSFRGVVLPAGRVVQFPEEVE